MSDVEEQKLALERRRLTLEERKISADEERFRIQKDDVLREAVARFAEVTIKSLLILNGGAALAVLNFSGKAPLYTNSDLSWIVLCFGIGAALAVLVAGLATVAQIFMVEPESDRAKNWGGGGLRLVAIAIAIASLVAFGVGIWLASDRLLP